MDINTINDSQLIHLDVGGTIFQTTYLTLKRSKYFMKLLSKITEDNIGKKIFIDESPEDFKHVLNILRDFNYPFPSEHLYLLDKFEINYYRKNSIPKNKYNIIDNNINVDNVDNISNNNITIYPLINDEMIDKSQFKYIMDCDEDPIFKEIDDNNDRYIIKNDGDEITLLFMDKYDYFIASKKILYRFNDGGNIFQKRNMSKIDHLCIYGITSFDFMNIYLIYCEISINICKNKFLQYSISRPFELPTFRSFTGESIRMIYGNYKNFLYNKEKYLKNDSEIDMYHISQNGYMIYFLQLSDKYINYIKKKENEEKQIEEKQNEIEFQSTINISDSHIFNLNVGGIKFKTTYKTLKKSEYFKDLIEDNINELTEEIFIDRSPEEFRHIISYLRNNQYPFPNNFEYSLKFFGIKNTNHNNKNIDLEKFKSYISITGKEHDPIFQFENIISENKIEDVIKNIKYFTQPIKIIFLDTNTFFTANIFYLSQINIFRDNIKEIYLQRYFYIKGLDIKMFNFLYNLVVVLYHSRYSVGNCDTVRYMVWKYNINENDIEKYLLKYHNYGSRDYESPEIANDTIVRSIINYMIHCYR